MMKKLTVVIILILSLACVLSFSACGNSTEPKPTEPTAPLDFTATAEGAQAELSWSAPLNDGGSPITYYEVSKDSGTTWATASGNTTHTFTDLIHETAYTFKVRAVNAVGVGETASATATILISTPGLEYTLLDNNTYSVSKGTATADEIFIASKHQGLPVTEIAINGFDGCTMTSVTIPNGVTEIGYRAFRDCANLTDITIPNSVTNIGEYAFTSCNNLISITLSDNVTSIGKYAFFNCTSLVNITIPDGVTSIGSHTFFNCTSLANITIPDGVTSIGKYAFIYCTNLTSLTIPESVASIGEFAFNGCTSLSSITISKNITTIGDSTFYACINLTIYCETSSKSTGWSAYWNNSCCPVVWGCTLSADKTYVESFTKSDSSFSYGSEDFNVPHRDGYTFGGWSTTKNGQTADFTALNVVIAPDGATVYAIWLTE